MFYSIITKDVVDFDLLWDSVTTTEQVFSDVGEIDLHEEYVLDKSDNS